MKRFRFTTENIPQILTVCNSKIISRLLIAIVFMFFIGFSACKDEVVPPEPPKSFSLENTSWQLVGFFNAESDSHITSPWEAFVWEYSYYVFDKWSFTLDFDSDTTLSGLTASNVIAGTYKIDNSSIIFDVYNSTAVQPKSQSREFLQVRDFYIRTLEKTDSFSYTEKELKLFYYDNNGIKNYLLYKRKGIIVPLPSFSSNSQENLFLKTSWKCKGLYDITTGEPINYPPPLNEISDMFNDSLYNFHYRLNFYNDTNIVGRTGFPFSGKYQVDFSKFALKFDCRVYGYDAADQDCGGLYIYFMRKVISFSLTANELKLFCNDNETYLLFERREYEDI